MPDLFILGTHGLIGKRKRSRFEELPGDQWQGHHMPENPVVGMVGFLLGHGLNNGVSQRRKTSSIAMRLAVLENPALREFPPESATANSLGRFGAAINRTHFSSRQ